MAVGMILFSSTQFVPRRLQHDYGCWTCARARRPRGFCDDDRRRGSERLSAASLYADVTASSPAYRQTLQQVRRYFALHGASTPDAKKARLSPSPARRSPIRLSTSLYRCLHGGRGTGGVDDPGVLPASAGRSYASPFGTLTALELVQASVVSREALVSVWNFWSAFDVPRPRPFELREP